MQSKYSQPRPLSSHTQTFQILLHSKDLKTLPEFKYLPPPKRENKLKLKANIFAHILQNFLISVKSDETDNFIAKIKYKLGGSSGYRLHIEGARLSQEEVNPEVFKAYFRGKKAQNLGGLTAFNLICSGHLVPGNLFITQSPITSSYYFSQGFQEFWVDFFDDFIHHLHIASYHTIYDKLMFFIPGDEAWWDATIEDCNEESLKQLFLNEFFSIYLRLKVTPIALFDKIMSKLFIYEDEEEVMRFKQNFQQRISWVVENFESLLSPLEKIKLKQYVNGQGHAELQQYLHEIEVYLQEFPIVSLDEFNSFRIHFIMQAMSIGIPHLEHYCSTPSIRDYSSQLQMNCFRYMVSRIEIQQESILMNRSHPYWEILDSIAALLHRDFECEEIIEIHLFHIYLFIKAIQYHQHYVALLILTRNDRFKNLSLRECSYFDPDKINLEGRTPLTVALYYKNTVMLGVLNAQGAKVSEADLVFLKDKLKVAVMTHDESLFAFVIQNCKPLLQHQHFEQELLALCHKHAPDLLIYLSLPAPLLAVPMPEPPRPNRMRRQSFSCAQDLSALAGKASNEENASHSIFGKF